MRPWNEATSASVRFIPSSAAISAIWSVVGGDTVIGLSLLMVVSVPVPRQSAARGGAVFRERSGRYAAKPVNSLTARLSVSCSFGICRSSTPPEIA